MVEPVHRSLANSVSTSSPKHLSLPYPIHRMTRACTSRRPPLFSRSSVIFELPSDAIPHSRSEKSYEMQRKDTIDIVTGIRSNTVGAAWLDLPSEFHTHTGVSMFTRAGSGFRVAGISSVWMGISSVSYLPRVDSQSRPALPLSPLLLFAVHDTWI